MLSPRLRLMVRGGSLGPRRGRLRANLSGSASILGRSLRVLSLLHLPWPHGASGRPSWAIALTCGSVLNNHVPMTHTTSHIRSPKAQPLTGTQPVPVPVAGAGRAGGRRWGRLHTEVTNVSECFRNVSSLGPETLCFRLGNNVSECFRLVGHQRTRQGSRTNVSTGIRE